MPEHPLTTDPTAGTTAPVVTRTNTVLAAPTGAAPAGPIPAVQ
jgi:hypothetical protein